MKVLRLFLAAVIAVGVTGTLSTPTVAAQETESRIIGKVLDESGASLPGSTVTVTGTDTGVARTVVAEADGSFVVTNLQTRTV